MTVDQNNLTSGENQRLAFEEKQAAKESSISIIELKPQIMNSSPAITPNYSQLFQMYLKSDL